MWNNSLPRRSEGENPAQPHFSTVRSVRKKLQVVASFSAPRSPTEHPDFLEVNRSPTDPSQQHRTERYGTRRALLVRFARVSVCHRLQSRGRGQQTGNHEQLAEKSKKTWPGDVYVYTIYTYYNICIILYYNISLHYIILHYIILYYITLYYNIIIL